MPLVMVFALVSCSNDANEDLATTNAVLVQNYDYNGEETQLIDQLNDYRESIGLNRLEVINHISYKSEEHNEYMIEKNELNHDFFPERSKNIMQVLGAVKVNENVAYNYSTPASVLHAWLNSPGHKANIEGNFTHMGVSVRTNPVNGNKYYTNIFMRK